MLLEFAVIFNISKLFPLYFVPYLADYFFQNNKGGGLGLLHFSYFVSFDVYSPSLHSLFANKHWHFPL